MLIPMLFALAAHAGAVTFSDVPKACEAQLIDLNAQADGRALIDHVDWREHWAEVKRLGYKVSQVRGQLEMGDIDHLDTRDFIRAATEFDDWDWGMTLDADDSRAIGAHRGFRLDNVPMWSALPGFDAAAAVRGYLTMHRPLSSNDRTMLAVTATFWLRGPNAGPAALEYLDHKGFDGWHPSIWLIQGHLNLDDRRAFLAKFIKTFGGAVLQSSDEQPYAALGLTPNALHDELPAPVAKFILDHWVDLQRFPPVTIRAARVALTEVEAAGSCERMSMGHLLALFPGAIADERSSECVRATYLFHGSKLIGVLKRHENRSFLALRNVIDAEGRLVMVMGGVYQIAVNNRIGSKNGDDMVRVAKVSAFKVRPLAFLLNHQYWLAKHWAEIRQIFVDHASPDAVARIDALGTRAWRFQDSSIRAEVWAALLETLDQRRRELEASLRPPKRL